MYLIVYKKKTTLEKDAKLVTYMSYLLNLIVFTWIMQEVVYHDVVRLLLRKKWKLFARWAFL